MAENQISFWVSDRARILLSSSAAKNKLHWICWTTVFRAGHLNQSWIYKALSKLYRKHLLSFSLSLFRSLSLSPPLFLFLFFVCFVYFVVVVESCNQLPNLCATLVTHTTCWTWAQFKTNRLHFLFGCSNRNFCLDIIYWSLYNALHSGKTSEKTRKKFKIDLRIPC